MCQKYFLHLRQKDTLPLLPISSHFPRPRNPFLTSLRFLSVRPAAPLRILRRGLTRTANFLYEFPFYAMAGLDQLLKFYLCFQWQKNRRVPLVSFLICITSSETHSSFMPQPLSSLSSSGCIPSTTSSMEAVSISQSHLLFLELHLHSIHIL